MSSAEERRADERRPPDERATPQPDVLQLAPGLARIALAAWWRTTEWALMTGLRTGVRVTQAAMSGEPPTDLFQAVGAELRDSLRRALALVDGDGAAPEGTPQAAAAAAEDRRNGSVESLRRRGAELLRQSAEVDFEVEAHPAYERILDSLAPDEARVLRFLYQQGPQPSVDVRTLGPLGIGVGSELVAPGVNMIGREAGCRRPERVHPYLNNLYRLGLVWFSHEPLEDQARYQVLEAQPEVTKAMAEAGRARTVRRTIHLTPFGRDFCETCLPVETDEIDALAKPPEPPPPGEALEP